MRQDSTSMVGQLTSALRRERAERARAEEALNACQARLDYDASHDRLTGLSNRALFMDRLSRAQGRARRHAGFEPAVLVVALDRLRLVNESIGYEAGDQMLFEAGRRLAACIRPADTLARLVGDEFVILCEDNGSADDVHALALRIQAELAAPFMLSEYEVFASAAIGIAVGGVGRESAEERLRDAGVAMRRAAACGRQGIEIFNDRMRDHSLARLRMETELRGAALRGELRVYYQPIFSLSDHRLRGFEALLRWEHPSLRLIPPDDFIPIAEESGMIVPIGQWVLREACRQMRAWQRLQPAASGLAVSVNVSARQFAHPDLIRNLAEVLQETGLDARSLKLEITETALIENSAQAESMLLQLHALGIEVQLDDFGMGYSSLSYLQRFHIDVLKIDRAFVSRINDHSDSTQDRAEIVRTIATLAQELNMELIGEGVETAAQLSKLRSLKCHFGQGYLFAKPLSHHEAEAFIADLAAA